MADPRISPETRLATYLLGAALIICGSSINSAAATLCVNPLGRRGCFNTISAAVAAASPNDTIQVAKGLYPEQVIIGKSLSLIGQDQRNTTIEAKGLSNGIYIDGIDNPGLSNVLVMGFTVTKANFEGILVANASSITISDNIVKRNDLALVISGSEESCPGLPDFETSEQDDCGEGIHLLGADHSIVRNNLVENNSGGILISDDTAPSVYNLISGNTVTNNPYDCGITLASHPAFGGAPASFGVTNNTVYQNTSTANGLAIPGAGAGVGIFASVPGANSSSNSAINNILTNNGLPGVTMHSHTPGQNLTNNLIVGNLISGNAADTGDAATSGPTGINVFGISPATGTIISGNGITKESLDIVVNTPANVDAHFNNLVDKAVGVQNLSTGVVDATENYWGCATGPGTAGCTSVSGTGTVLFVPFGTSPF